MTRLAIAAQIMATLSVFAPRKKKSATAATPTKERKRESVRKLRSWDIVIVLYSNADGIDIYCTGSRHRQEHGAPEGVLVADT